MIFMSVKKSLTISAIVGYFSFLGCATTGVQPATVDPMSGVIQQEIWLCKSAMFTPPIKIVKISKELAPSEFVLVAHHYNNRQDYLEIKIDGILYTLREDSYDTYVTGHPYYYVFRTGIFTLSSDMVQNLAKASKITFAYQLLAHTPASQTVGMWDVSVSMEVLRNFLK